MPLPGGTLALATRSRANVVLFERSTTGAWTETATIPRGIANTTDNTNPASLAGTASTSGAFVVTYATGGLLVVRRGAAGWAAQTVLRGGFNVAVLGAGETRGGTAAPADFVLTGSATTSQTAGPARVYRADGAAWTEEAAFSPAVPVAGSLRAHALDLDAAGRVLAYLTSAPMGTSDNTALYVFRRDAPGVWTEVAQTALPPSTNTPRTVWGAWGAWGGRAVVGAPGFASNGTNSGGAWVVDLRPVLPVAGEDGPDAGGIALSAPAPNPVRGAARVTVSLPEAARLDVRLFNVLGQEVARVADGEHAAGAHALAVETAGLAPGVYLLRATAGTRAETRRMTVVR